MSQWPLPAEPPPGILVVDDDPTSRALVQTILEPTYRVFQAADGPSAIATLRADPSIDVVLLDVMMPGMSGYEACRVIKRDPALGWTPVLLLTALLGQESRNEGLEAGADEFLSKPIDARELRLRVQLFVRLRQKDRQIAYQLNELREIDGLKDDLVSLIVHDLRNPLAGMLGLLDAMRESAKDPELYGDIDAVSAAADRLRGIVDDLEKARQLEQGKLSLAREIVTPETLFGGVKAALSSSADERGVSLVASATPEAAAFVADRRLLTRALENLASNALRYSNRGSAVELRARTSDELVELEVADRGPGIADEVKRTLFSKFGGAAGPRAGRHGHGVGLYLVMLAVVAHGGAVTCTEREGGGALFMISLPRVTSLPTEAA